MMKNKKGNVQYMFAGLLANPLILLGLGVFLVLMMVMMYFMLGKIVGTIMILVGTVSFLKRTWAWYISILMILIGLFMFINPMQLSMLSMIPRG